MLSKPTRNRMAELLVQLREHKREGELHEFIDWSANDLEYVLQTALWEDGKHEREQSEVA